MSVRLATPSPAAGIPRLDARRSFAFGTLEVDTDGTLTIGVVNTAGERESSLAVPAQQPTGERGDERERVRTSFAGSE
jgi:hypothetical protein